jgi:hypothetical protein
VYRGRGDVVERSHNICPIILEMRKMFEKEEDEQRTASSRLEVQVRRELLVCIGKLLKSR